MSNFHSTIFLVSNTFSEAMCNLIKSLLDGKIVDSNTVMEKLPMSQVINLSTLSVSIY